MVGFIIPFRPNLLDSAILFMRKLSEKTKFASTLRFFATEPAVAYFSIVEKIRIIENICEI
jgi:hypothetical protein